MQGIRMNGDAARRGVIGGSSRGLMVRSFQHVEVAVDEYRMTWSDAIRAETDFLETQRMHHGCEDARQPDAVGPALGRERSLTWILGLAAVRADEARKIISNLHAALRPVFVERSAERAASPAGD